MDMQGAPIGGSSQGTKNTTDPRSNDAIHEAAGGVARDSLAAESYRAGGGFQENRGGEPDGVSGSSVTWNTTDTSAASKLDSARDHASRDSDSAQRYPEALGGQGSFRGAHNADGYVGGPSGSTGRSGQNTGSGSGDGSYGGDSSNDFSSSSAGVAPNYTLAQQGAFAEKKPHGKNITEGGFTGEGTNYESGIGTRDDPGRAGLKEIEQRNARSDYSSGIQGGNERDQPYDSLARDERA